MVFGLRQNFIGQADITQAQSNLTVSEAQFYQVTGVTPDNLVAIKQPSLHG
jgi:outer membrane protein TolC